MNKPVYGPVATIEDVKRLEEVAVSLGSHAVGFTKKKIYRWDDKAKDVVEISVDEAKDILELEDEDLANEIINSRGRYVIPEPVVEVKPKEPVITDPIVELTPEESDVDEAEDEDDDYEDEYEEVSLKIELLEELVDIERSRLSIEKKRYDTECDIANELKAINEKLERSILE